MLKFPWVKPLASYGSTDDGSIESLAADPDSKLIPDVAEKIVVPWITSKSFRFSLQLFFKLISSSHLIF